MPRTQKAQGLAACRINDSASPHKTQGFCREPFKIPKKTFKVCYNSCFFQINNSLRSPSGLMASFFASSFASIPEITCLTFGFVAALSITKLSSILLLPIFCRLYEVFISEPIASHSSLSYASNIFSEKSFALSAFAIALAANLPDVIAFPPPSPEKGSIREAASPTKTQPLPWFLRWYDPSGRVHTFIPCASIFATLFQEKGL